MLFRSLKANHNASTYTLDLPLQLKERRIHPTFHVSRLRVHIPSDDSLFPHRDLVAVYDFGQPDNSICVVDEIVGHEWTSPSRVKFVVRWADGDITREPYKNVSEAQKLDEYFELMGVSTWHDLPKHPKKR